MPDLHYTDPRLAQLYDADCGPSDESGFYLSLATHSPIRILDLGCGTGWLCNAYADLGHAVTGVDPANAMLHVARTKPYGNAIIWVADTAQTFRSPQRFDLIVMTGHAFQTLTTDADIAAALITMRTHLAPGGTIAFETRNPNINWADRWHGFKRDQVMAGQSIRQSFEVLATGENHVTFATHYAFPEIKLTSTSTLRFLPHDTLENLIVDSGLKIKSVFGDWNGSPFEAASSDEMIFRLGS